MISSLIGWVIVGVAIVYVSRGARRKKIDSNEGADLSTCASQNSASDAVWCDTLEVFHDDASIILDSSLKLVAAGAKARKLFGDIEKESHLIDILPGDAVETFLEGIAAAKRGECRRWECSVGGHNFKASAVAVGESQVAIIMGGSK